ncbi:MAG TPA: PQQ-binding-like beta-propeller repeat protein, partial [Pirellulales bacterium]|nr:PQQ-binding-like beta-propeller repeat protein [Pirellulales bacterium]
PMYNRDLAGSRHNPGETAINNSNAGKLVERWRFPAKDAKDAIGVIHATPVVVNGYVYFGTANEDPTFYKLAPDGTLRWSYRNPMYVREQGKPGALQKVAQSLGVGLQRSSTGAIFSSALVTDDSVFFSDMEGWIYALDRATGKEKWKLSTRAKEFPDAHPMNLSMASPIMADGKLIIAGGTLEQIIAGSFFYRGSTGRGFVLAIDPKLGKLLWKYDLGVKPTPLDPPITITDASGAHTFYYGPATSSIWSTPSFDAESGTIYFGTDVNTAPRQPTDDNKNLHTRESCSVIALDVRDGSEKWLTQINPGDVWTNAMISYDPKEGRYKDQSIGDTPKLYTIPLDGKPTKVVGVGCKNGGFYVLDAATGRIVTHTPLYTGPPTYPLTPTPDKRMLALPSAIGGLQTGCATDGKTVYTNGIDALWLASLKPPAPKGGPISGGRVVAISLDTKSERWRHERPKVASLGGPPPKAVFTDAGDPVASGIAVANGVVYFTAVASGKLVALDAASGGVLNEIDLGPVWSGPSVSRGRVYVGTGNRQFSPADYETFLPKKYTGVLYSFGLPGDDEVSRLGVGNE